MAKILYLAINSSKKCLLNSPRIAGLVLSLLTLLLNPTAHALNRTQKLHQLDQQINHLTKQLASYADQRQVITDTLEQTEQQISSMSAQQSLLSEILAAKQVKTRALKQAIDDTKQQLRTQERTVDQLSRAIYMLGPSPVLQALFSPQDQQLHSRQLAYYQYIVDDYTRAVADLNLTRLSLAQQHQVLQHEAQQIETVAQQLALKRQQRLSAYQQHQRKLDTLDQHKKSTQQQLKALQATHQQLEQLIANATINIPKHFKHYTHPFIHHRLSWPTRGRLIQHFGSVIAHSRLHTDAIVIRAKRGAPVRAVADGKVLYSGWMSHYGQLLIISHRDDYLSLYGYNEALTVKAGDWIQGGQLIASVGQSGGQHQPSLYFAIRHHSHAVNPLKWLKR